MASESTAARGNKKLRVLLIPFFATSHIQPFTELALSLATANDDVETTMAVTPANVSIVKSLLERWHNPAAVKIGTYEFPSVEGLPKGVENLGKAVTRDESLLIQVASMSEALMRPVQEALIHAQSPDAIVSDMAFVWNSGIAAKLGVPCVIFSVLGAFSVLAMNHLKDVVAPNDAVVLVPRFPVPKIGIPKAELPEFLRRQDKSMAELFVSIQADCFGLAMNTSSELEKQYCEMYTSEGYAKRAYFLGPLSLRPLPPPPSSSSSSMLATAEDCVIMDWLDSKPNRSVVYVSFGSLANVKDAQLDEIALGLETSGKSFLWVVRGKEKWTPPKGWEERVKNQDLGLIIRAWAPQTAILGHKAVGAFVTQCGWNSVLETVAAGVPVLTWPILFEQFITERLLTQVLGIGERLFPGLRREESWYDDDDDEEDEVVVLGKDVARALTTFMKPGGTGDMARSRVLDLSAKARAAVAQGGSSHRDLHRLVDDLIMAAAKRTPS
uniref:Uncharacterized protein n=1 Tax=Avena sativa TaxID=4498 RepID=A0ACD5V9M1_AVESA